MVDKVLHLSLPSSVRIFLFSFINFYFFRVFSSSDDEKPNDKRYADSKSHTLTGWLTSSVGAEGAAAAGGTPLRGTAAP